MVLIFGNLISTIAVRIVDPVAKLCDQVVDSLKSPVRSNAGTYRPSLAGGRTSMDHEKPHGSRYPVTQNCLAMMC